MVRQELTTLIPNLVERLNLPVFAKCSNVYS